MGARHGAQNSAVWASDSAIGLLDGIEASVQGKRLAEERLRALHPLSEGKDQHSTDFEKRLRKVFEKQSDGHPPQWLTLEFWQREIDNVLVQGIFGRSGSKVGVVDRIHAVWPDFSAAWLHDRMEEVARQGLPQWVQNEFWAEEVDPILLAGLEQANRFRREAIAKALKEYPVLQIGVVSNRVRALRTQQNGRPKATSFAGTAAPWPRIVPAGGSAAAGNSIGATCSTDREVWRAADSILLAGVREANQCEREAVDKVLGKFSELRIEAIWARFRRLRYKQKRNGPLRWTGELDDRLIRVHREGGLSAAVSDIQNLTDWPRRAILRRAHRLGLPKEALADRRRWTMAEFRFALESVNHLSVREIADELERSEKGVWDMLGSRGIPARFQDGCSVRDLSTKLHIRRPSIRAWIKAGQLHKKRNGRISEDSVQSFLHDHPERINWSLLDEDTTFWVSELLKAEKIRVTGSGTRTRANSRNSDGSLAAAASTLDGNASSTLEADPSEDPVSHNSRARGASPEL
jgi:hypothetical protein